MFDSFGLLGLMVYEGGNKLASDSSCLIGALMGFALFFGTVLLGWCMEGCP
jgi:hypothetical protein